ncbi:Probable NADH-ubiquinone oxidoreductase, mitochondrial [Sparassis crispa]|uniref:NADH:ubiquinone reductase (non-electrogenic) n=1 Tax=Sparassis crispa TaxID=139825 RepID=A0A401GPP3_9APHY|nr:Probable NADH-ubiquinone oxidoreductase, mitochondrial [Sparassis crispa]GBE84186.1 Probable NADH-ubiquinone oxidoreductase, mitochondrial [Sparassis crispa]
MQYVKARSVVGRSLVRPRQPATTSHTHTLRLQLARRLASTEATPLTPPSPRRFSIIKRFLQTLGGFTLLSAGTVATFYYFAQKDRTPGHQLPHDPEKKTLVILGSGWGATSLLNSLDTSEYNVVLISPRNYFLFTPLLPSVAVGTLNPRSIIQPTRYVTRHKARQVAVIEAHATSVDPVAKTVTFEDTSEIQGLVSLTTINYDYLVFAVGAEVQTFNIPGVKEYACFMKELEDAEKMQRRFLDCLESAAFPGQSQDEVDRLLHMVVVGGGPTGIELSGEIHDFLEEDLRSWFPELANSVRISLVEALPSVLPMFSKRLIEYTEAQFKQAKIDILTKTMVKEIKEKSVVLQMPDKSIVEVPCGMVVWAAGNTGRQVTRDLMSKLPEHQTNKRGIVVDDHLRMLGTDRTIFALGDCTATSYAPTAQVASQEGAYLARILAQIAKADNLESRLHALRSSPETPESKAEITSIGRQLNRTRKLRPFEYSHQGSLAYIGSDKAIADLPFFNGNLATGGVATFLFWRSAYLSTLFSLRNRTLVATDWIKVKLFGRDVSRE